MSEVLPASLRIGAFCLEAALSPLALKIARFASEECSMKKFRLIKVLVLLVALLVPVIGAYAYGAMPQERHSPSSPLVRCIGDACHVLTGVDSVECSAEGCVITFRESLLPDDLVRGFARMVCNQEGCLVPKRALARVSSNKLPDDCHAERCLMEFKTP